MQADSPVVIVAPGEDTGKRHVARKMRPPTMHDGLADERRFSSFSYLAGVVVVVVVVVFFIIV